MTVREREIEREKEKREKVLGWRVGRERVQRERDRER